MKRYPKKFQWEISYRYISKWQKNQIISTLMKYLIVLKTWCLNESKYMTKCYPSKKCYFVFSCTSQNYFENSSHNEWLSLHKQITIKATEDTETQGAMLGLYAGHPLWELTWVLLMKIKLNLPTLIWVKSKAFMFILQEDTYTCMFVLTLFVVSKIWNQPFYLLID